MRFNRVQGCTDDQDRMNILRVLEKAGSTGILASAFGCAACFPALATISSALGLGILSGYEVIAITVLLTAFAGLALIVNAVVWYKHRQHFRGLLSVIGPGMALSMLFPRWFYIWNTYAFYAAIILMLTVSIYDLFRPVTSQAR